MLDIFRARRVSAMRTTENVKRMMRCGDTEAATMLAEAQSVCANADARRAVQTLNDLTDILNMSTEQMLKAFA